MKYLNKINENRAPAGLERVILKCTPWIAILCLAIPALVAAAARLLIDPAAAKVLMRVDIAAIAVAVTALTATLTVAIGAVIVFIMKGPGYVADAYALNESSAPAPTRKT